MLSPDKAGNEMLLRSARQQLETHLEFTSSLTGLKCPGLPGFPDLESIKGFTSLIDSTVDHPWRNWWDNISDVKKKYSFAHSLFLFRKVLPSGDKDEAVRSFIEKMSKSTPDPDPSFLRHIRLGIRRLFKKGWDRHYEQTARDLTLSTSSCLENGRSDFGARGSNSRLCRLAFQRAVGTEPFPETGHYCRVSPVKDGSKWRVVTINSGLCEALKPLHRILYNHLAQFDWLCRGKPNVRGFASKQGEVFVSGDYESATDSIPIPIYEVMLDEVLRLSDAVPSSVKAFAKSEARKIFVDSRLNVIGHQKRGQLMGSYLSFPFLCLLNYLCFTFSVKRDVPLLINGDDIVFRATPEEKERWVSNVKRSGLILSRGKTLVHNKVFTLNSTLFYGGKHSGHSVTYFRPKCYFNCPKNGVGAAGQFNELVVGSPGSPAKDRIQVAFLRRYSSFLLKRQYPLRGGLGFRVSDRVLRMGGFADHERFYLGLGVEKPKNLTGVVPGGFVRSTLPKMGKARRDARASETLFFKELLELTWLPPVKVDYVEPIGTFRYQFPLSATKPMMRFIGSLARGRSVFLGDLACRKLGKEKGKFWENIRAYRPVPPKFSPGGVVGGTMG